MSLGIGVGARPRRRVRARAEHHVDLVQAGHAVVKHGLAPWQAQYLRFAASSEFIIATVAAFASVALRGAIVGRPWESWLDTAASTRAAVVLLPVAWILCLRRTGAYAARYIGAGNEEYRSIFRALILLLATASVFSYAFKLEVSRAFVGFALPSIVLLTIASRWRLRRRLHKSRLRGGALQTTVVVGPAGAVADMIRQIQRDPSGSGLHVVGACVSEADERPFSSTINGVSVLGGSDDTISVVDAAAADVVVVASSGELVGESLRRLGWQLEYRGVDLLVAPGIIEVAGPRLSLRPADGLPLLHVERPLTQGLSYDAKTVIDRILATLAVLVLSPLLLAIAVMVKLDSKGPALFKQTRVGTGGVLFSMYKFRSMVVDAEHRLPSLGELSDGNGMLFKMRVDPRITRVGRFLRKYSLDELPQLLNVVRGQMSMVGPRPPLPSEVDAYEFDALRRLRVRPGMTGLWQVSGRSDLTWEDSLRLDLWYVDNWSPSLDLQILTRTVRAVLNGSGAY